jgi:hypothetical protein
VPDGIRVEGAVYDEVDTIGCSDQLVRIEDNSLTLPVQALEKMITYNDTKNGYDAFHCACA